MIATKWFATIYAVKRTWQRCPFNGPAGTYFVAVAGSALSSQLNPASHGRPTTQNLCPSRIQECHRPTESCCLRLMGLGCSCLLVRACMDYPQLFMTNIWYRLCTMMTSLLSFPVLFLIRRLLSPLPGLLCHNPVLHLTIICVSPADEAMGFNSVVLPRKWITQGMIAYALVCMSLYVNLFCYC